MLSFFLLFHLLHRVFTQWFYTIFKTRIVNTSKQCRCELSHRYRLRIRNGDELMKRIIVVLLMAALMIVATLSAYADSNEITVIHNGSEIVFDQLPEIVNGRTMVPVRAVFEAFDMDVRWESDTRTVTAIKDGLVIELVIGSLEPVVNGKTVVIDSVSYIKNGRTLVPLRFIAESTGAVNHYLSD